MRYFYAIILWVVFSFCLNAFSGTATTQSQTANQNSRHTEPVSEVSSSEQQSNHDIFIDSIHQKVKVMLKFRSSTDNKILERKCAPMDYAFSRRYNDSEKRYHFWDYDGDTEPHPLSIFADQLISITPTSEHFVPAEFVTWDTTESPWSVPRDWGDYS